MVGRLGTPTIPFSGKKGLENGGFILSLLSSVSLGVPDSGPPQDRGGIAWCNSG